LNFLFGLAKFWKNYLFAPVIKTSFILKEVFDFYQKKITQTCMTAVNAGGGAAAQSAKVLF